jgi:hypothetical protein
MYIYFFLTTIFMKKLTFIIVLLFTIQLALAQTGNYNAGSRSLFNVTSGDYNLAVGDSTLYNTTSGSFNTALGFAAGKNITTGTSTQAVFLGFKAGYHNTTGYDNTFIGFLAGYYNTNKSDNTFIGNAAGFNNTEGDDNTFLGESAGLNNTTGDDNTFIGHKTGGAANANSVVNFSPATASPATGSDNTAVGSSALGRLTSGYRNTAIGNDAGYDLTTGYYNTFVGDSTGIDLGTGKYNTFIGQAAGAATEHTSGNTFVGYRSGWDNNRTNTTDNRATENTYFGYRTGHTNREGSYNLILGARADFNNLGYNNVNRYNVGLGYGVIIGGNNNTIAIGASSKVTANNAIAIGYQSEATIANTMVLGGDLVTNRVSVGIGTKTPNIKASLDLADTDKGFLVNRVTNAQRTTLGESLIADDIGMLVYDTEDKVLYTWKGDAWSSSTIDGLDARVTALETIANNSSTDKTPLFFNYQTAVLNVNDEPLLNTNVSFRISILKDTNSGTSVYQETHSATTNSKGLTGFKIGNGVVVSGTFSTIEWSDAIYFLKVEADVAGGTSYQDFGTTQLVSVPYALHAKTADRLTGSDSAKTASKVPNELTNDNQDDLESLKNEVKVLKAMVDKLEKMIKNK